MTVADPIHARRVLAHEERLLFAEVSVGDEKVLILHRRHFPGSLQREQIPVLESTEGIAAAIYPGLGNWMEYLPLRRWCSEHNIPLYYSPITQAFSAVHTAHLSPAKPLPEENVLPRGEAITVGGWKITMRLRSEEVPERVSVQLEHSGQRAVYAGPGPHAETSAGDAEGFPAGCDLLIVDQLGWRHGQENEDELGGLLFEKFRATKELALVNFATPQINRFLTVYRSLQAAGRQFVIDPYMAETLLGARSAGFEKLPDPRDHETGLIVIVPGILSRRPGQKEKFIETYGAPDVGVLLKQLRESPGRYGFLFRELTASDPFVATGLPLDQARYYHLMWGGYMSPRPGREAPRWRELIAKHKIPVETSQRDIDKSRRYSRDQKSPVEKFVDAMKAVEILHVSADPRGKTKPSH